MPEDIYQNYHDYFKNHYGAKFSLQDAETQAKFLYNQLVFAAKVSNLDKFKDKTILEIGSGLGALAKLLLEAGFKNYHGIEMDKDMAEFTNRSMGNHFENISLGDFSRNAGEKVDVIFAFEVLEHLADPRVGIKEIKSLLNEGGVFIGTSPFPFKKNVLADKTHNFVLHPTNWKNIFKDEGFSLVDTYPMSYLPFFWRINKNLNVRIPFYLPFPFFISTTLIVAYF